ncbi:GNAT family N-acetyltransferase [Nocardioides sp. zg-536]|uniref:GNAT family N-acetyltransferase n=1 Tax=Nocardioides faecalis TaxID=2803858 RepID=A0A939BZT3_9ACTN|nr:GNAT family N-acetyltransferase [Nocardioides faecalis]MBM9461395.1 GNAT family N-acetyltransferase [Nocardioides faecalis]QVI57656.1 GNAT family N-acetyltransferase [Nocardioides faecalis]
MVTADVSVRVGWPADAPGIAAVQLRCWRRRYDAAALPLPSEDGPTRTSAVEDGPGEGRLTVAGLSVTDLAEAWRASLSRPPEARHRALVALAHDTVVGFALTVPASDPDADPASDGEVVELTVDPERTRAGHGSRLLQACADTLEADGFTRAVCWVGTTDDTLRAFLTSAGWATDGATRELQEAAGTVVRQVRLHTALW